MVVVNSFYIKKNRYTRNKRTPTTIVISPTPIGSSSFSPNATLMNSFICGQNYNFKLSLYGFFPTLCLVLAGAAVSGIDRETARTK